MMPPIASIESVDASPPMQLMRLVRPLLEQFLARVSRLQETPLQFEIDTTGIALASWSSFLVALAESDRQQLSDGTRLCAALDLLIEQALGDTDPQSETNSCESVGCWQSRSSTQQSAEAARSQMQQGPLVLIVEWLDELCNLLRGIDLTAIEVVRLRVEGYGPRDIADRLGTGTRLVRHLLADARSQLNQARRQD
jgi:hypothetical protein